MPAETKPLMIYDGDCGFCRRWIAHWQVTLGERVAYATYQDVAGRFPQIPMESFKAAVHLVEPDGRVSRGAEAVVRALAYSPGRRWPRWAYDHLPGVAPLLEGAYTLIAARRRRAAAVTRGLWGDAVGPSSYVVVRWGFLRLLGLCYLAAFWSLATQVHGLIGAHGISPAGPYLHAARQQLGPLAWVVLPTLGWWHAGDGMLTALCGIGLLASVLLVADVAPALMLAGLWAGYLSLVVMGQEFLAFQWDALLLEAGFLAILFAPLRVWPRLPARDVPPSPWALWLLRWLLFRLVFCSGVVKLASGDPGWRTLTALISHYETQPLPTWIGWYAHQLPGWCHVAGCAVMFAVELGAPWLILAPRRPRGWGAVSLIALQVVIALTGNYGFFNLLTVTLCLLLLDDDWLGARLIQERGPEAIPRGRRWPPWVVGPLAIGLVTLSLLPPRQIVSAVAASWYLVNPYGLFAVMTTTRREIVLEGSRDGVTWVPYEFRWKPGPLGRRPAFVAPHQPRLDWQMWFAALSPAIEPPWLARLRWHLRRGTPEVTRLLAADPFPGAPPRQVRAVLYDYRFSDPATRARTGAWWLRRVDASPRPAGQWLRRPAHPESPR